MKSRIRRWEAFFLMFAMLLARLALMQPVAHAQAKEPDRELLPRRGPWGPARD